jgi:hypothetical protein
VGAGAQEMDGVAITGLVFAILGGMLFAGRLYHRYGLGEFWNNMPVLLSWGITVAVAGFTIIVAAFAIDVMKCDDGCSRTGIDDVGSLIAVGGITVIIGGVMWKCCCCSQGKPEELEDRYDWGDEDEGIEAFDERPSKSGIDILFITMGLAILVTSARMGDCPASCGVAVVANPFGTPAPG